MDNVLHKEYKDVHLTPQQVNMFADLIMTDEAIQKIFLVIGQETIDASKNDTEGFGITITDIKKLVKINRKVKKRRGFEDTYTEIDQKHAERVVANLLLMSLCYFRPVGKAKLINYTYRGRQVAAEVLKRIKLKSKEGLSENVHA